jgi:hypothetical protein
MAFVAETFKDLTSDPPFDDKLVRSPLQDRMGFERPPGPNAARERVERLSW